MHALTVAWMMIVDSSTIVGLLNLADGGPVHLLHHVHVLLLKAGDLEVPS